MTIATSASLCLIEFFYLDEVALFMLGKHHLCNALAVIDDEVLL